MNSFNITTADMTHALGDFSDVFAKEIASLLRKVSVKRRPDFCSHMDYGVVLAMYALYMVYHYQKNGHGRVPFNIADQIWDMASAAAYFKVSGFKEQPEGTLAASKLLFWSQLKQENTIPDVLQYLEEMGFHDPNI